MIQSTPHENMWYQGIDAAKTKFLNSYEKYPEVNKRINKAIGGRRGKLPAFFIYSKNGRKDLRLPVKDRKTYAKPNGSTMNRLCSVFDDIGNINMTRAKVAPFNWQMLLRDNNAKYYPEAVETFCTLDDGSVAMKIYSQEEDDDTKSQRFMFLSEYIAEELQTIAPLDVLYPGIVKYLFAGNGMNKAAHKLMFWRIFGDMACEILQENMQTYSVCENCGMKIPAWVSRHDCPKDIAGFFECIDCGAWCTRENSKQCRCKDCQITYRKDYIRMSRMNSYNPTVRGRYKKDTA